MGRGVCPSGSCAALPEVAFVHEELSEMQKVSSVNPSLRSVAQHRMWP